MPDKLQNVVDAAVHAAALVADRTAQVEIGWLLLGTVLYVVSQAVRTRAWHTILRAAYPGASGLRPVHVMRAYLAGSGVNAVVPARGGDVVKLGLLHRRIEGASYTTLAATFVPEMLFEALLGALLVAWVLSAGLLPVGLPGADLPALEFAVRHPFISAAVAAVASAVAIVAVRRLADRLRQGLAILRAPGRFATGVASWQALARVIRLGSLAAFLAAFSLPATIETAALVMAAQGGGRIVPVPMANAGLRLAVLSFGFAQLTGQAVDVAGLAAFMLGMGAVLCLVGLGVAAACVAAELGTVSPRRSLAFARAAIRRPAPARRPAA